MIHFIWNRFTRFVDIISQTHTYNTHVSRLITVSAMAAATVLSLIYHRINPAGTANIALIYILTVILISYHTDKYRYGILAAICSVFFINLFTYPFFVFNFAVSGYPLTFLFMYFISILTSATTFRLKEQARRIKDDEDLIMEAEKEKLRANLLRAVSHDLRTPLTSIIGASSSYLDNEETLSAEEKRRLVSQISEDADWLLHMVENLLSVTRITDSGANTLKKNPEVMEEVLLDAISTIRKRYPSMQIHMSLPDELLIVPMDPLLIKQVIMNLLENAYFHAHSQKPVECFLRSSAESASVHIRDYGIGIPKEHTDDIFDAAPSSPSSASDTRKGMGIGLSICKAIINAHGGSIHAVSHPDGAEFYFTLPKEELHHESDGQNPRH
ncbi:sensor histidine kinase [Lachnoclostridium sp. An196]|uniref:sensor histidine kinase n=1 Tax=Lachnoclostridium sp. An196 TaxID=1965583 RepID=UPI001FA8E94D|nr:DUF4118 domain-containing protein [Lachnoclostridium sp. An196]